MKPEDLPAVPLELAASLPPDDPVRQEVEEACAAAGGEVARRWLECLHESERLRLELHRVEVPDGLHDRLLRPRRIRLQWLLAAASVVLVLAGVAGGLLWQRQVEFHRRLIAMGILAINTHINDRHVSVRGSDPAEVARRLDRMLPFPVRMPHGLEALRLIGGRGGSLGACPAAYTLWRGPSGDTSVIQIRLADFALTAIPLQEVDVRSPAFDPHPCHVTIWSDGGMGFLLVTDTHS